jgi:hypothetical protein
MEQPSFTTSYCSCFESDTFLLEIVGSSAESAAWMEQGSSRFMKQVSPFCNACRGRYTGQDRWKDKNVRIGERAVLIPGTLRFPAPYLKGPRRSAAWDVCTSNQSWLCKPPACASTTAVSNPPSHSCRSCRQPFLPCLRLHSSPLARECPARHELALSHPLIPRFHPILLSLWKPEAAAKSSVALPVKDVNTLVRETGPALLQC